MPVHASNVGTAQVDKYRRHLRIAAPAFNQELYSSAWDETITAFSALGDSQHWNGRKSIELSNLTLLTSKFTSDIIVKKGFGMELPPDSSYAQGQDEVTLREAFELMSTYAPLRAGLPPWILKLPIKLLKRINFAHNMLVSTLQRHINTYRTQVETEGTENSIFSSILNANQSEVPGNTLSPDELLSNVFFVLFAGHGV